MVTCTTDQTAHHTGEKHNTIEESVPSTAIAFLTFLRGTSEALKRVLESHDFRVVLLSCCTIKDLVVVPKDTIKDECKANVVYSILCADCPNSYVEETKRRLDKQLKEHQSAVEYYNHEVSALDERA